MDELLDIANSLVCMIQDEIDKVLYVKIHPNDDKSNYNLYVYFSQYISDKESADVCLCSVSINAERITFSQFSGSSHDVAVPRKVSFSDINVSGVSVPGSDCHHFNVTYDLINPESINLALKHIREVGEWKCLSGHRKNSFEFPKSLPHQHGDGASKINDGAEKPQERVFVDITTEELVQSLSEMIKEIDGVVYSEIHEDKQIHVYTKLEEDYCMCLCKVDINYETIVFKLGGMKLSYSLLNPKSVDTVFEHVKKVVELKHNASVEELLKLKKDAGIT